MSEIKINRKEVTISLVMPVNRPLPWQTAISMIETKSLLQSYGLDMIIQIIAGCSQVHNARNEAVSAFLESDKTRMFWIDSDIAWKADDFMRLVALSSQMDVICGVYPKKSDPIQFQVAAPVPGPDDEPNEFGCYSIGGTGLGFTIVARHVIEELAAKAPIVRYCDKNMSYVFRGDDVVNGSVVGEDIAFFSDVRKAGHTVWFDPSLTLSHIGDKAYTASFAEMADNHIRGNNASNEQV